MEENVPLKGPYPPVQQQQMALTPYPPPYPEGQPPQMHPLPRPVTAQPSSMDHTTAGYPGYTPAHPGYTPAPSVAQPPLMTPPQSYQQGPQGNEIVPSPPNMTTQPGWVPLIDSGSAGLPPNIPPGLEYLAELDQILIHQVVEILEVVTSIETDNKYAVKNKMGQQCYYAQEESRCCAKQCCKNRRGFVMKITDNTMREVIRARREFRCCGTTCCCLPCCSCTRHEIFIEVPPGIVIGRVHNQCTFWRQQLSVKVGDAEGSEEVLKIVGPCCISRGPFVCFDTVFKIESSSDGSEVGRLTKQFSGLAKEVFTDADNFSLTFPKDLDIRVKAILMGSAFLIDFLYYEDNQPKEIEK